MEEGVSAMNAVLPGSVSPGPRCGGQGRNACVKAAGTFRTERDLVHCDVTMLLTGVGAWGHAGGVSHPGTRRGGGPPLKYVLGRNDIAGPHYVTPVVQGFRGTAGGGHSPMAPSLPDTNFLTLSVHFKGLAS